MTEFLKQRGNYRSLIVYQKAECIYDITHCFAHTYLNKGDRTVDQMVIREQMSQVRRQWRDTRSAGATETTEASGKTPQPSQPTLSPPKPQ